ncbi:MAG TPA: hypothetical protein PLE54_11470 [Burkholderiaceae bacterium]|nr:hypothetical protein [Burkholderiaceae bacterium]HQR71216.1 hypothetical protein [Burkholderiaceae bacterium]
MKRSLCAALAVMMSAAVQIGPIHAQVSSRDAVPRGTPAQPRVVEVKGDTVVIADAKGRRQTLQLTTTHGLKPGLPSGWCEDDCRAIRIGETTFAVKGRAPIK